MNRTANARSNQKLRKRQRRRERQGRRRETLTVTADSVRSKLRSAAADVARDAWEREAMGGVA